MKALLIDRQPTKALMLPPRLEIVADSAVTLPGRPVFLPDFDTQWTARFYLAARISRLGKDISVKFAPRYYDALTLAMRLIPVNTTAQLTDTQAPLGVLGLFDCALSMGTWDVDATTDEATIRIGELTCQLTGIQSIVAETIATVSRYATLKIGDAVMPLTLSADIAVEQGHDINGTLNDTPVLSLRIR